MAQPPFPDQSVAIFAAREDAPQVARAITACGRSAGELPTVCDVLVNGNPKLADEVAKRLRQGHERSPSHSIRVWYISVPDKAHAWNAYFQHIWPNATTSFFVDGYVMPRKNSFALLSTALQEHPDAYAASAVSTIGFSSRKQQRFQERNTGINGNLFAMTNTAIVCLRESGFRLPRGLYRTDPTMQSFLKLDFKPGSGKANRRRVVVVKEATYDRRAFSPFKLSDLRTQWRRVLRQRQGDLEIQAVRQLLSVRKIDPRQMPDTVRDLIVGWMHESPRQWWVMAAANPLRLLAARHVRAFCDWSAAADPPELVLTVE